MRTIERTSQFKRDYKREAKGSYRASYKWTDEQGKVHYSDQKPEDRDFNDLRSEVAPTVVRLT